MSSKPKATGYLGFIQSFNHAVGTAGSAIEKAVIAGARNGAFGIVGGEIYNLLHHESTKTKDTKKTTTTASSSSSSPVIVGNATQYKGAYSYNAPMVKDAYFNPTPKSVQNGKVFGQQDDGVFAQVDLQKYTDVMNAWQVTKDGKLNASKGAIQMDRYLWKSSPVGQQLSAANAKKGIKPVMNGFRFLYNPTSINMTWGQMSFTSNQALLQGLDQIVPAAPGSMNSAISFWIPINRIQDGDYLNPDGSYKDINPYGETVSLAERQMIYERGTMYDLEWVMKAINGWYATGHKSDLNGVTNDMGFMLQFPVELHLGNKLRYRVQITDISINHVFFNSRMVPIYSTINFTCRRFPDYNYAQIAADNKTATGTTK